MAKLVNATKLIPLQRGFVAGYRRDRHKARRELRALAQSLDDELVALQDDIAAIELVRKPLSNAYR